MIKQNSLERPYYLVHANIAAMRAPLDDPVMADFVAAINEIDLIAQASPGFIVQPTLPDEGAIFGGLTLLNVSIWESVEGLKDFTYQGKHLWAMSKRKRWFEPRSGPNYVLYWMLAGEMTSEAEIKRRLDLLALKGPTPLAFTFKQYFTAEDLLNDRETLP